METTQNYELFKETTEKVIKLIQDGNTVKWLSAPKALEKAGMFNYSVSYEYETKLDTIIDNYIKKSGVNVKHQYAPNQGQHPAFELNTDTLFIPPYLTKKLGWVYYAGLFHELSHSTGIDSRLKRVSMNMTSIKLAYFTGRITILNGIEEIIADLSACFIGVALGLGEAAFNNNVAYLKNWCNNINADPVAIRSIMDDAIASANLILSA